MCQFRKVLLVEDEASLRELISATLTNQGYEIVAAETGSIAEAIFLEELPDFAIVDMMLPGSSGFQVLRLLNERSNGRVPVAMMSGNLATAHQELALMSGADVFLQKPFSLKDLIETTERLCPIEHRSGNAGSRTGQSLTAGISLCCNVVTASVDATTPYC